MRAESKDQDLSLLISNRAYYQEILQQLCTDKVSEIVKWKHKLNKLLL